MESTSDDDVLSPKTLRDFLELNKDQSDKGLLIERLTDLTVKIVADSFDTSFHVLLDKNGWDDQKAAYREDMNMETFTANLQQYVKRREENVPSIRASEMDSKNRIKSFAPDMLMTYTSENKFHLKKTKLTPFSVFFDGVCLLADISGFTRLSGKFCEAGKDGIDELQQVVNGYLGQLVKIVYAYGGDVMKFAGDALVCVFQPSRYVVAGRELTVADACSNAVQCATELAQVCTAQLTIHVAVSCGPICFAILGGHDNIWECLVSGQCLGHLSQCLEDAGSKQTVVSPQLIEMLGPKYRKELNIEQLSSGNYRVISAMKIDSLINRRMIKRRGEMLMKDSESRFAMFPSDDNFLKTVGLFVPMPVTVGLSSGTFDYLAELREVTTMFMSWDSYNEEVHMDLLSLQQCFVAAQKVLAESGGFIRQFLIDDKGCVLIACWGVPTASHPDNTRRALCAGANIGYELNELGMKTSVGITTGNVFCGSVGSYVRREYAVIGDVVNLAARLMSKAKGGLYIDEATHARIPVFLRQYLQKLAPMAIKGKDIPIAAYSLKKGMKKISLNDKGDGEIKIEILSIRPHCRGPLVQGMERISNDESCTLKCILLEGRAGTGKVEVVDWLRLTGPRMDIRAIKVSMNASDAAVPFSLVAKLFRLMVREAIFDDAESQEIVLRQIFRNIYKADTESIEKVAYPAVKCALGVDSATMRRLPKRVLQECLKDIFFYLLNLFPVVIVIENVHLADSVSLETIQLLLGTPCSGLVVMTMEPVEDIRAVVFDRNSIELPAPEGKEAFSPDTPIFFRLLRNYKKLTRCPHILLVAMNDYSVLDVDQLLCNVLNLEVCPEGVSSNVHQLSGGDPFWCRELAQFIQATGTDEFARAMAVSRDPSYFEQREGLEKSASRNPCKVSGTESNFSGPESAQQSPKNSPNFKNSSTPTPTKDLMKHVSKHFFRTESSSKIPHLDAPQGTRTATIGKLELFIVCRLETLSREDQNILRTASIIGKQFSKEILYGILSPKMRTQMFSSILSLVKSQWIVETTDSVSRRDIDGVDYSFVHPLFYQTLYDLTPAGDKARLHYSVAAYIEQSYEGKATHYAQLGRHFGVAKDCKPKALEYYVRAAVACLLNGPLFYDQVLGLLMKSTKFADSAMDFGSILGILIDGNQRLTAARKIMLQWIQEEAFAKNTSWKNCRNPRLLFKWRSNKIRSAPTLEKSSMRLEAKLVGLDKLIVLFSEMEEHVNALYTDMVDLNCVGVVSEWQRPHLKVWKDSITKGEALIRKASFLMNRRDSRRGSNRSFGGNIVKDGLIKCMRKFSSEALNTSEHPRLMNSINVSKNASRLNSVNASRLNSVYPSREHLDLKSQPLVESSSSRTYSLPLTASQLFNDGDVKTDNDVKTDVKSDTINNINGNRKFIRVTNNNTEKEGCKIS